MKEIIAGFAAGIGVMLSWIGTLEWRLRNLNNNKVNKALCNGNTERIHHRITELKDDMNNRIDEFKADMKDEFKEVKEMIREK